jgi:hypothetical protein
LHEDDWHFKLMRWQLIALYIIIGDGGLSLRTPWCPLMQLVTQWQGWRRDVSRLLTLRFLAIPGCPLHPKSVRKREKRPGVDLASEHERESYSIRRTV